MSQSGIKVHFSNSRNSFCCNGLCSIRPLLNFLSHDKISRKSMIFIEKRHYSSEALFPCGMKKITAMGELLREKLSTNYFLGIVRLSAQ
jgi:hypothetical protein